MHQCLASLTSTASQVWLVLVQKMKNVLWSTFPCTDKDPNCAITSWYINLRQVSHNSICANEVLKVLFFLSPDDRTKCFIEKWWRRMIEFTSAGVFEFVYFRGNGLRKWSRVFKHTKKTGWNIWKNPFEIEIMWCTMKVTTKSQSSCFHSFYIAVEKLSCQQSVDPKLFLVNTYLPKYWKFLKQWENEMLNT